MWHKCELIEHKIYKKISKLSRNYKPRAMPPFKRGGRLIAMPNEIVEIFADHYKEISLKEKRKP